MSTATINFKTTLLLGETSVPLASETVVGDSAARDGVGRGFVFKLDRAPLSPPVTVHLGQVIDFISKKLHGGNLLQKKNMDLIHQAFPDISASNFNAENQMLVNIYEFSLNSSTSELLFSFNLDVKNANPNHGLIRLPAALTSWLRIENLAISFSATRQS